MRIVRYLRGERVGYGILEGDRIRETAADVIEGRLVAGAYFPREDARLLCPCEPTKIVAVGLNYRDHVREMGGEVPEEPLLFLKPATAVLPHEGEILYPAMSTRLDFEGELGVVIGRAARDVSVEEAPRHILGYTCFNDVTARDLQFKDGQFTRSKGFDTFAPFGPWIETDVDPADLRLETFLNGQRRQSSTTAELIFSPAALVSFVSRIMTLLPGDLIATGTPSGVGPMEPGDVVEVAIEGIGTLRNTVRRRG